jgi:hypothetical protein
VNWRKYQVRIVAPKNGIEWCEEVEPTRSGEFIGENLPRREELQFVIDALNSKELFWPGPREDFNDYDQMLHQAPPLLRKIVRSWQRYQKKRFGLTRFFKANPQFAQDVARYWRDNPTTLGGADVGGGAVIALGADAPGQTPSDEALRFFVLLVTNPLCDKLAGPCANCEKYYFRGSAKNTKYCSPSCGRRATAVAATTESRKKARAVKLERAARLAQEWTTARTILEWKQWVHSRDPDITPKFLTGAVNEGDLKVPVRRLRKAGKAQPKGGK